MPRLVQPVVLASICSLSLLTACATQAPKASNALPKSVPALAVVVDCGKCKVRPTVPELIRSSYAAAAAKAGVPIAGDTQMTLTITDYTERGMAIRVASLIVGPPAMILKDEIKAVAVVNGEPLPLKFNRRIPFRGIDSVAQKLGELGFDTAAHAASAPSDARLSMAH